MDATETVGEEGLRRRVLDSMSAPCGEDDRAKLDAYRDAVESRVRAELAAKVRDYDKRPFYFGMLWLERDAVLALLEPTP